MSTQDNGGPAFPTNTENSDNVGACYANYGMTLRDFFAAKAMQGLLADSELKASMDEFAERAYAVADAMLKARQQ